MNRMAKMLLALVLSAAAGCGGGGGAAGPAGVDSSKQVSAASAADKESLCDWVAGMVGGYGSTPACSSAVLTAPPDKATCVSDFPSCAVTVAEFESCVEMVVSAQNACTQQALTTAESSPECQTVGAAGCFN